MDQMESLVMKKGWPVPFTDYYLVNHDQLLGVVDQLRASLQDELDARLIDAYSNDEVVNDEPLSDGPRQSYRLETMKQNGLVGARSAR